MKWIKRYLNRHKQKTIAFIRCIAYYYLILHVLKQVQSDVITSAIYFGKLVGNNFWKIYWNVPSLLQYFSIYILKLFVCIILQAFSNQTWFDLNSQCSLKFSAKMCFFINVNTSLSKYLTSNIILVCFLKSKKKNKKKYKSTFV